VSIKLEKQLMTLAGHMAIVVFRASGSDSLASELSYFWYTLHHESRPHKDVKGCTHIDTLFNTLRSGISSRWHVAALSMFALPAATNSQRRG
jgi:hypothetical protein